MFSWILALLLAVTCFVLATGYLWLVKRRRKEMQLGLQALAGMHWRNFSDLVKRALQEPVRQIANNAGDEGSVVVGKILENNTASFGFNAQTEEYGDLVKMGVIDPAKVVRTALQDAASVAGILITTEAAVADAPKKSGGASSPDMGGMGGMGGMDF